MDHEGKLQTIIYNIVEILFKFFQFIQTYFHCSRSINYSWLVVDGDSWKLGIMHVKYNLINHILYHQTVAVVHLIF